MKYFFTKYKGCKNQVLQFYKMTGGLPEVDDKYRYVLTISETVAITPLLLPYLNFNSINEFKEFFNPFVNILIMPLDDMAIMVLCENDDKHIISVLQERERLVELFKE